MAIEDQPMRRKEVCSVSTVRRVAAMLDIDPDSVEEGQPLPRGWHFILMGADTRRSDLRADGFPGLGIPMPDLGLTRLLLVGRSVAFVSDVPIGIGLTRETRIRSIKEDVNANGPRALVTIGHELRVDGGEPALVETQTYLLLPAQARPGVTKATDVLPAATAEHRSTVTPDDTMLFQYSALGFNSHRIHSDRSYAREIEGFPDLVVNGGLATLLLTEFLRNAVGLRLASIKARHLTPLFSDRPVQLAATRESGRWRATAYDDTNRPAVEVEVEAL